MGGEVFGIGNPVVGAGGDLDLQGQKTCHPFGSQDGQSIAPYTFSTFAFFWLSSFFSAHKFCKNVTYPDKQILCNWGCYKLCGIKSYGSWWNINRQYKTSSLKHALRAFYLAWNPHRIQNNSLPPSAIMHQF